MLPKSSIVAFSNSKSQKAYIDGVAAEKGLKNIEVITGNVVDYEFEPASFDRVVSIEVSFHTHTYPLPLTTPPSLF
jgi:cyclopropane fatty-acyl-phospholipid synthase-like methyltransferase